MPGDAMAMRALLMSFVRSLTNDGHNGFKMLTIDHDALWDCVGRARTVLGAHPRLPAEPFMAMETAPKDATMVRLLVDYSEGHHPLDDADVTWTIGFNNDDNVGEGEGNGWQFVGWSWSQDCFTDGDGRPIGWLPWENPPAPEAEGINNAVR